MNLQPQPRLELSTHEYARSSYRRNPRFDESPDEPYYLIDRLGYTPERYAECALDWKRIGAQVIGGCCATGPDHIAELRRALAAQ